MSDLDAIRAAPPPPAPRTRAARSTVTAESSDGLSRNGPLDSPTPEEEASFMAEEEASFMTEEEAALMAELTEFRRRQSSGQSL